MKNIIEINGHQYDSQTGKLISKPTNLASHQSISDKKILNNRQGTIDGIKNHTPKVITNKIRTAPEIQASEANNKARSAINSRQVVAPRQRSLTLNRSIVKKPLNNAKYIHAKSKVLNNSQKPMKNTEMIGKVPTDRLNRAIIHEKSPKIKRFNNHRGIKKIVSNEIKVHHNNNDSTSLMNSHHQSESFSFHLNSAKNNIKTEKYHTKSNLKKSSFKTKLKLLAPKNKIIGSLATVFALFILAGFIAYQRVPDVAIRVAASKAGFNATVPNNVAAGYSYKGPMKVDNESITINYMNKQSRQYEVTQEPTSWTNDSLLSKYIKTTNQPYQTYYDSNMTVYIYENNNATWIKDGVWFVLKSDGSLTKEQLLSIASST